MQLTLDQRQPYADAVPAYVRPSEDGTWQVVSTADDAPISVEHASPRAALTAALEDEALGLARKAVVLRTDGEPDGEWRWLDAAAVEDEPVGDVRIAERALWDLAGDLNSTPKAAPVNGGPNPDGMGRSRPHGDATNGGDELANGWAHVALPVIDEAGRTRLFLFCELIPEVAREVDRGRLAFGSVYIAFEGVNEDDKMSVYGAQLISHALTNDQAIKTLSPGSERSRHSGTGASRVAFRTTRMTHMSDQSAAPSATTNPVAPATETVRAEGDAPMDPAAMEAALSGFMSLLRDVFGKPDASPEELLAELDARKEQLGAATGNDVAPDSGTPAEDEAAMADKKGDPEEEFPPGAEKPEDEDEEDKKKPKSAERAAVHATALRERDEARRERDAARTAVTRFETRDWLTKLLRDCKKSLPVETHERWVDLAIANGRDAVDTLVKQLNVPPSGTVMKARDGSGPVTFDEATALCLEDAAKALPEDARQEHMVWAKAQKIARQRFPNLATADRG